MQKCNRSNIHGGDDTCSGLSGVGLLNDNGCRSGTQKQRLENIGGSTARGCGDCCDGESDVKNGVTLIKTRLLRKCQSSGFDTMLEILKSIVLYFIMNEYT